MELAIGLALLAAGATVLWFFRSADGISLHPVVRIPGMEVLLSLAALVLFAMGGGEVMRWLISLAN